MFHSDIDSRARGVAILIRNKIHFSLTKLIADKNGRYLIVVGTLMNIPVVLVNVYAPNFDNTLFANNLLRMIPDLNTHLLIFGGDLNCVIDPALDKSATGSKASSAMSRAFSHFMTQNGYIDPWRFFNPQAREYSFFQMFITHILASITFL